MATVDDLLGSRGTLTQAGSVSSQTTTPRRTRHPRPSRRPRRPRPIWPAVAIAAGVVLVVAIGLLVTDQVSERDRYDRAHASLIATSQQIATVSSDLAALQHALDDLHTQVGSDTTALNQEASQLQGAQAALTAAQEHVVAQGSQISSLHTCLGGVEQALNALSVGHRTRAFTQLVSVSSSCAAAVAVG